MASFYRLLLLLSVIVASVAAPRSQRTKRGLYQLTGTIGCTTGSSSWAYWWYGCYCGLGGYGTPKDSTDWCCYQHDRCYGIAEKYGCYPKLTWYQWTCEDGTAECGHMTELCGKLVCYCDTKFANCLKNAHYSYDYVLWPGYLCGN